MTLIGQKDLASSYVLLSRSLARSFSCSLPRVCVCRRRNPGSQPWFSPRCFSTPLHCSCWRLQLQPFARLLPFLVEQLDGSCLRLHVVCGIWLDCASWRCPCLTTVCRITNRRPFTDTFSICRIVCLAVGVQAKWGEGNSIIKPYHHTHVRVMKVAVVSRNTLCLRYLRYQALCSAPHAGLEDHRPHGREMLMLTSGIGIPGIHSPGTKTPPAAVLGSALLAGAE